MREPGVMEKVVPGEFVRMDLEGEVDGPLWLRIPVWVYAIIAALLGQGGGDPDDVVRQGVHVGTTEHDLVIAHMAWFGRVRRVQRIPLNKLTVVSFEPGDLYDKVKLDAGDAKPVLLYFYHMKRQATQGLIDALGGVQEQAKPEAISGKGKPVKPETSSAR